MRAAIGQTVGSPDIAANLAAIAAQVARAAEAGVTLIVLPEYAMFKQAVRDEQFLATAEPLDGPFASSVRELARSHAIAIAIGVHERIPDEPRAFNTLLLVGSDGQDIGAYRKIHLYDAFGGSESRWVRPGPLDQPLVFDIDGLRVGTMTCYDLRFPEMARLLVDDGAEVLLIPSAWTPGPRKEDHWQTLVRARAIENVAYVVAPSMAPPFGTGGSLVVDPMGVVLAELGEQPGVAWADLEADRVAAVRQTNPTLEHRRFRTAPTAHPADSAR